MNGLRLKMCIIQRFYLVNVVNVDESYKEFGFIHISCIYY